MWYSLVKIQFALMRRISILREDTVHDMRICSRQRAAESQKEISLSWCQFLLARFVPVGELYTPSVTTDSNDWVRQR